MRWRRRFARVLAPVAFLAALTIAVQLVRAGLRSDDEAAPATTAVTSAPATTATTRPTTTRPARTTTTSAPDFYVIQAGDTLDKVALEHDTTVARLLELNPGVDTNSLQIGQRIRVK